MSCAITKQRAMNIEIESYLVNHDGRQPLLVLPKILRLDFDSLPYAIRQSLEFYKRTLFSSELFNFIWKLFLGEYTFFDLNHKRLLIN